MRLILWMMGLMLVGAGLVGCADSKQKCGNKFLVLWPTETGGQSFREISLSTLSNPYELSGGAAKIYFESGISEKGFEGAVAQPRFTSSDGTCVPMDAQSSAAVTTYAHFEEIMKFEEKWGIAGLLTWPRKVGVDIHVTGENGTTHNNAHYFSAGDSIAILPFVTSGLALTLNPGVLAHEHFHAHFQRQVISEVDARLNGRVPGVDSIFYPGISLPKPTVEGVTLENFRTIRGLNAFVLRSWNEGLADFYGAIYSRNPNFFEGSLPHLNQLRGLNQDLTTIMTAFEFGNRAKQALKPQDLEHISYAQGTSMARMLYKLAFSGIETPEQFLVRIIHRLREIPAQISPNFENQVIEFERIIPVLLRDFPLNPTVCGHIRKTVSGDMMNGSFSRCSSL